MNFGSFQLFHFIIYSRASFLQRLILMHFDFYRFLLKCCTSLVSIANKIRILTKETNSSAVFLYFQSSLQCSVSVPSTCFFRLPVYARLSFVRGSTLYQFLRFFVNCCAPTTNMESTNIARKQNIKVLLMLPC